MAWFSVTNKYPPVKRGGYLLQKQENGSLAQPQAKKGAGRVSAVASSAFRGAGFCLFAETAF